MNALVVDTSVWIGYFSGMDYPELDLALKRGQVFLSPVVAAELLSGKLSESKKTELISFLKDLPECQCDLDHWLRVGNLRSMLARKGVTVSTPDAHLAQCAIDTDSSLYSQDLIFRKIEKKTNLKLFN